MDGDSRSGGERHGDVVGECCAADGVGGHFGFGDNRARGIDLLGVGAAVVFIVYIGVDIGDAAGLCAVVVEDDVEFVDIVKRMVVESLAAHFGSGCDLLAGPFAEKFADLGAFGPCIHVEGCGSLNVYGDGGVGVNLLVGYGAVVGLAVVAAHAPVHSHGLAVVHVLADGERAGGANREGLAGAVADLIPAGGGDFVERNGHGESFGLERTAVGRE